MQWQGKIGEEMRVRQVSSKLVQRWTRAQVMKAFWRWEEAVEDTRAASKMSAEKAEMAAEKAEMERLQRDLMLAEQAVNEIQREVVMIFKEMGSQHASILKLSELKISRLGKELEGLKALVEKERETRRNAEQQAQKLVRTCHFHLHMCSYSP